VTPNIRPIPGYHEDYGVDSAGGVWSQSARANGAAAGAVVVEIAGVRWRRLTYQHSYSIRTAAGEWVKRSGETLRAAAFAGGSGAAWRGQGTPERDAAQARSRAKGDDIRDIMRITDTIGTAAAMEFLGVDEAVWRRAGVGIVVLDGAAELARRCEAGELEGLARRERRARLDGFAEWMGGA